MAATRLPQETLKQIQSMLRSFFWSNSNKKGTPLIAWSKITKSKSLGGLGLRDLSALNETMMLKNLWSVDANREAVWVQVVANKYFPKGTIWSTSRTTRCTNFWKALLQTRPLLSPHVKWQLGDGSVCEALGQPWFDMWGHALPQSALQRRLKVMDLVNAQDGQWKTESLIQQFGFHIALFISIAVPPPSISALHQDRLLFTYATNGKFTFRKAYQFRVQGGTGGVIGDTHVWKTVWQIKGVIPRVQVFLWKCCHNALPVGDLFNRRWGTQNISCRICGAAQEDIMHVLFHCPRVKQMWFTSKLGLRTETLPSSFSATLLLLKDMLSGMDFISVLHLMWSYWKLYCKEIHEGAKFTMQQVHSMAISFDRIAVLTTLPPQLPVLTTTEGSNEEVDLGHVCFVDGSYLDTGLAGWACMLMDGEVLLEYSVQHGLAASPLHAELKALHLAFKRVAMRSLSKCLFLTNCATISNIINEKISPESVDWRLFPECLEVLHIFKLHCNWSCRRIDRNDNVVADELAKYARVHRVDACGTTFPIFSHSYSTSL